MFRKTRMIPASERPERAQIMALTLLSIAAYLPLVRHLDPKVSLFVGLVWLLRFAALRWQAVAPGAWVLVGLTLIGGGNALLAYQGWSGRDAGTALFVTMVTLKLLELRRLDDLRLVASLIGFLIVVQFLFDESPWLLAYLGGVSLGVITLLVMLDGGSGTARMRPALRVAGRLALQALPLTLILFLLFPRLSAPLWSLGVETGRAKTGMSDWLEPGAISELVLDGELAFRVRFDSPPPGPDQLYWRGPVLWETDGRRWTPGLAIVPPVSAPSLLEADQLIEYEVTLEPNNQRWWLALDLPVTVPAGAFLTTEHQLVAAESVSAAQRYRVTSALAYRTDSLDTERWAAGLQVPDNVTPRMRALVAEWRARVGDGDWALIQEALGYFNRESFHYTLLPPALGSNPVDEFLFETRRGFCEHYASSFALLMRLAGIPSRIVLGYLGGELNRVGGYHMVWQSDAHAWVEVWSETGGWVRVDPTAAVNPARVDHRGASQVLGAGPSVRFTLEQADAMVRLARQLRLFGDSLDAAWQDWVLGFSVEDQMALLSRLRLGELREYGLVALLLPALSLTLGLLLFGALRERRVVDPLTRLYARLGARLARVGLARGGHEGPADYGRRVSAARPDLAPRVERFLELYIPARYGALPKADAIAALTALLRDFHPRPVPRAKPRRRPRAHDAT